MDARLPAHLEVAALIRQVNAEGGFAAVLAKGERDAGTILVVLAHNGGNPRLFERMPDLWIVELDVAKGERFIGA